ncbi:cation transport regulator ChaC [Tumebacillus sp. BK434]|uniref:gamma-glutamylcyclotransferase n=1 Tax=Tumebacillus sp. BK434 TaxID=2512169 RepID=UPI00104759ED|nr:gamma-glutamylcyclotransferase [Tumebacillus sp. BK434]TCP58110.1 cation transport regulator ChaC [Tumebacillus sp. BK434]
MAETVFVYGDFEQAGVRVAEQSWIEGTLWDTGKGYPAASLGTGGQRVYGSLYELEPAELAQWEALAGQRGLSRQTVQAETDRGAVAALAFVQLAEEIPDSFAKIELGDWHVHRKMNSLPLLYFAYASCLDTERFQLAGVDGHFADIAGLGVLHGYALRFTYLAGDGAGRADVVEEGGAVEGKVYRIGQEARDYLWVREGVLTAEYRPAFITVEMNGELHEALTFLVVHKAPADIPPPAHYVTEILRGADGFVTPEYFAFLQKVTGQTGGR